MSAHNASISHLFLCFVTCFLILSDFMVAPALSFQIHRMSRVGRSGVLENSLLWSYRIRQTESSLQRISHKTLLNLSTGSIPTYSKSKQQNQSLERQGKSRDMASLAEWSRSCGIALADGIELTEDLLGDWSLSTTKRFVILSLFIMDSASILKIFFCITSGFFVITSVTFIVIKS